jgi:cation transporter-like permease
VVSLPLYKAQARRAAAAAQAAAGRRAVICLALALLGMVAGVVALEREARIQQVEVRRG